MKYRTNLAGALPDVRAASQTLHENTWLSLRQARKPEAGVSGYVYSHETRCRGRIVAVLPFRDTLAGRQFLVKSEMTPCWGFDQVLSAVTGGWEGGDIEDDAVREMLEETGYTITRADLIPLGESFASKSSDTVYSLFSADLTGREPGEAAGDGSRLESESSAVWIGPAELAGIADPQVAVMFLRLGHHHVSTPPDLASRSCCDLHGRRCEPPSELCCEDCTEADHPGHRYRGPCSNPDLSPDSLADARKPPAAVSTAETAMLSAEELGKLVRDTWVRWAQEQPAPEPSWLTPWEELDGGQRDVDTLIGETVAAAERAAIRQLAAEYGAACCRGRASDAAPAMRTAGQSVTIERCQCLASRPEAIPFADLIGGDPARLVHWTPEEPDQPACDADTLPGAPPVMLGVLNPARVTCPRCRILAGGGR